MKTIMAVLALLAKNKEQNKWQIKKVLKKSYGNIHVTIQGLKDKGLLEVYRTKKSAKNPNQQVEYYGLTFRGLENALILDSSLWNEIDQVAKTHADKLLVFKKWDFFEKEGLKETVKKSLRSTLKEMYKVLMLLSLVGFEPTLFHKSDVVDAMTLGCYSAASMGLKQPKIHSKIMACCRKDKELSDFIVSKLKELKQQAEGQLEKIEEVVKWVPS